MNTRVINLIPKLVLLSAIVLLAIVASTQAQSLGGTRIRANIPFDFQISETKLPAGEYSLGRAINQSDDLIVSISDMKGRSKGLRLTNAVVRSRPNGKALLVFHRYGDQYFLFQVWPAGATTGRELRKSKSEREAQEQLAREGVAKNLKVETVTIEGTLQ